MFLESFLYSCYVYIFGILLLLKSFKYVLIKNNDYNSCLKGIKYYRNFLCILILI